MTEGVMEMTPEMTHSLDCMMIENEASARYASSDSYQAQLATAYQRNHFFAYPPAEGEGSGNQWPGHSRKHPHSIHISANIIRPFYLVEARIEAILPRITQATSTLPASDLKRAEKVEQLALTWLELSGWDVWMGTLTQVKGLYGKGILKPFWDDRDRRGDVYCIEQPENLRIGWGRSDFSVKDWALYEMRMSVEEAERQYDISVARGAGGKGYVVRLQGEENDPLRQKHTGPDALAAAPYRSPSQYEEDMCNLWDYWWREDNKIWNAILIEGRIVKGPDLHSELPDIPYIVIEHDHEPGNPDGISTVETMLDLQIEFNRLLTHAAQHVRDNVDPAWQATGEEGMNIEAGTVPRSGEILPVGNALIQPISTGTNTMPFSELIREFWNTAHRITGLPEILFGQAPSDISGRATAIQIQSAVNRLDPRRARLYRGLMELLNFWLYMAEKKDPHMPLPDGSTGSLAKLVSGMNRWRIVAPELTPRDSQELVATEGQKVTLGLSSARTSMDAIGMESPEAEQDLIREERSDIILRPDAVQQTVSIYPIMLQVQEQLAALQQQVTDMGAQQQGPGMSPTAQAQKAGNVAQQEQMAQQAASGPVTEDQNQPLPGQQTLIRAGGSPGGQALNQLSVST